MAATKEQYQETYSDPATLFIDRKPLAQLRDQQQLAIAAVIHIADRLLRTGFVLEAGGALCTAMLRVRGQGARGEQGASTASHRAVVCSPIIRHTSAQRMLIM